MFNSVHSPFQRSTWHDVGIFVGQELQHSLINTCRTVCHWLKENLSVKKDTFLSPEVGIYKITFYKQKKWNVSTYKALFILIKLNVLLNEINVFLCYACFKNQFNCWAKSLCTYQLKPRPPPHPGPRWGFDLTSLQILANSHHTGAYWLVKPPPRWGNLLNSLTDFINISFEFSTS